MSASDHRLIINIVYGKRSKASWRRIAPGTRPHHWDMALTVQCLRCTTPGFRDTLSCTAACCLAFSLFAIRSLLPQPIQAQSQQEIWTPPIRLSTSSGFLSQPVIVSDQNCHLHVFWIENPTTTRGDNRTGAIVHTHWNGHNWSEPIDILAAPSGHLIKEFAVALDKESQLHLLLLETQGTLLHSSTDLAVAGQARLWPPLDKLVFDPVLAADIQSLDGSLYVPYVLGEAPFELYAIRSDDRGTSWTWPVQVSRAEGRGEIPIGASLDIGPDGALHLAWAQYTLPDGYPPKGIYYARSTDRGETWNPPLEVQTGLYGAPALNVTGKNRVYLAYNGAVAIGGRYFQWSPDGGNIWTDPITIAPGVGGLTGNTVALDSAGRLHYATAGDAADFSGIAYAHWDGFGWSSLANIAGTPSRHREDVRQGYEPNLIITGGNRVHIVYVGADHGDVWYVSADSGAPSVLPDPWPTQPRLEPATQATVDGKATPVMALTSSPVPQSIALRKMDQGLPANLSMLVGIMPAFFIVGVVVVAFWIRRAR